MANVLILSIIILIEDDSSSSLSILKTNPTFDGSLWIGRFEEEVPNSLAPARSIVPSIPRVFVETEDDFLGRFASAPFVSVVLKGRRDCQLIVDFFQQILYIYHVLK